MGVSRFRIWNTVRRTDGLGPTRWVVFDYLNTRVALRVCRGRSRASNVSDTNAPRPSHVYRCLFLETNCIIIRQKASFYPRISPFFILGHRCHCRGFPLKPLAARFGS